MGTGVGEVDTGDGNGGGDGVGLDVVFSMPCRSLDTVKLKLVSES